MTEDAVRFRGIPARIELSDGVVVRAYTAEDIPEVVDVVNDNLEHLRPWMPWAQEPATVASQLAWWEQMQRDAEEGRGFPYGVYTPEGRLVGGTGFHARGGPGVLEIGYWLAADVVGSGLMTRVVSALVEAARGIDGVERIEIKCDEANVRSSAIPRRLGLTLVAVEQRELAAPAETGYHQVWSLDLR